MGAQDEDPSPPEPDGAPGPEAPAGPEDGSGDGGAPSPSVTWAGLLLGPLLALLVYAVLPADDLRSTDRAVAAIATLMAVYWMTEALPLPATSLLPILLLPFTDIFGTGDGLPSRIRQAARPYAHEFIFLFLGGFLIAQAIERWNLHRRIALLTILVAGTRPDRLIAGFMVATAFLSMWISNTATTAMMLPIGMSVVSLVSERLARHGDRGPAVAGAETRGGGEAVSRFAVCLMLAIAYAASIGGVGTLIGTPPNLFLAGFLSDRYDVELGFGRWMLLALPFVAVFLAATWLALTRWVFPLRLDEIPGGRDLIRRELGALGRLSRGEWIVLAVFLLTAAMWILREPLASWDALAELVPAVRRLHDTTIALAGALLLFALPVDAKRRVFALDWRAARRLPWGVLLLFGGGLSLATAIHASRLPGWLGAQFSAELPLLALIVLVSATIVFLTEVTSNTATVTVFLPIVASIALAAGTDPLTLALPAALAGSCAFMLPVATPPNAIVFGSGRVTIPQMVRAGLLLNVLSVVLISLLVVTAGAWVFGLDL